MPVSRDFDLSPFMAVHARPVADLGSLSRELRALCSFTRGDGEAGEGCREIGIACHMLGRVGLAVIEAERGFAMTGFEDDTSSVIGFVLDGIVRASFAGSPPQLECRAGEGLILAQRRAAIMTIEGGTRLLMVELPAAALHAARPQPVGARRPDELAPLCFIPAASRAGSIVKHGAMLCAGELAAPGSALNSTASGERFERFVLSMLVRDLAAGVGQPPSGCHDGRAFTGRRPRFDAA